MWQSPPLRGLAVSSFTWKWSGCPKATICEEAQASYVTMGEKRERGPAFHCYDARCVSKAIWKVPAPAAILLKPQKRPQGRPADIVTVQRAQCPTHTEANVTVLVLGKRKRCIVRWTARRQEARLKSTSLVWGSVKLL